MPLGSRHLLRPAVALASRFGLRRAAGPEHETRPWPGA